MGLIKLGIISVIVFALLITGISLFFPSHIRVSKAVDINVQRDSLKNALSNPVNWKKWYPGADTMEFLVEGEKITGLKMPHSGAIIRLSSVSDSSVTVRNTGGGIKKSISGWNIYSSNYPNTFTVQWYMDFHLGWLPWAKFSGLLLEKRYGPTMEKGLEKLKEIVENR